MSAGVRQQLVISGLGGQGVLFITRLLAEAAIRNAHPVFTSETHGMAQRGGTVISHLKVGDFSSPLIRPGEANGLIALKAENLELHGGYVEAGGWAAVNSATLPESAGERSLYHVDADRIAGAIENSRAVNLIMLGFTLSQFETARNGQQALFCNLDDITAVLENRMRGKGRLLEASIQAILAGMNPVRMPGSSP